MFYPFKLQTNQNRTWKQDFFLQIFWCFAIFALSTGGAFWIKWEAIKKWRDLHTTLIAGFSVVAVWLAFVRYRKDASTFSQLEPVRILKRIIEAPPWLPLAIITTAFWFTQTLYQFIRFESLEYGLWDMGFYDQVLWNTARGDFMITSVRGGVSVLSEHMKLNLILISVIYRFVENPFVLLALTNVIHASSLAAVYGISRNIKLSHRASLLVTLAFFFYQPWIRSVSFLYHTQVLSTPFLLWTFYFALRRKFETAQIFLVLALGCKQSLVFEVAGMTLYFWATRNPFWKRTLFWTVLFFSFYLFWVKPNFFLAQHSKNLWRFYDYLQHPIQNWQLLWKPNPFLYLFDITGPFLFLSLRTLKGFLLALPAFCLRLLSPDLRHINAHYTGGMDALTIVAALEGFLAISSTHRVIGKVKLKTHFISRIPAALLLGTICFSGAPQMMSVDQYLRYFDQAPIQRVKKILSTIPKEYSVLSSERFATHLNHRRYYFASCQMFSNTPYTTRMNHADLVMIDTERTQGCEAQYLTEYTQRGYQKIFEADFLTIYHNEQHSKPIPGQLLKKWQEIKKEEGVPYRKIWHQIYRLVSLGIALALVLFLVRHTRKVKSLEVTAAPDLS